MLILSKKVLTSFLRSANEPVVDELIEKIGTKNSSKDERKFKGSAPKYDCDRTVKLKSMLLQPIWTPLLYLSSCLALQTFDKS